MFRPRPLQPRPDPTLPSIPIPSFPNRCTRHLLRSARHSSLCDIASILPPDCPGLVGVTSHASPTANIFRICSYRKHTPNPFRIHTSKTQDLNSFRIRTYEKTGGVGVIIVNDKSDQGFVSRTTIGSEGSLFSPEEGCLSRTTIGTDGPLFTRDGQRFRPCRKAIPSQAAARKPLPDRYLFTSLHHYFPIPKGDDLSPWLRVRNCTTPEPHTSDFLVSPSKFQIPGIFSSSPRYSLMIGCIRGRVPNPILKESANETCFSSNGFARRCAHRFAPGARGAKTGTCKVIPESW